MKIKNSYGDKVPTPQEMTKKQLEDRVEALETELNNTKDDLELSQMMMDFLNQDLVSFMARINEEIDKISPK